MKLIATVAILMMAYIIARFSGPLMWDETDLAMGKKTIFNFAHIVTLILTVIALGGIWGA